MSVLDELSKLEEGVRARMTELRPLLNEYAELEKAAQRLGIVTAGAEKPSGRRAGGKGSGASKTRRAAASQSPEAAAETVAEAEPRAATTRTRAKAAAKPKKSGSTAAAAKKSRQPGGSRSGQRAEQLEALVQKRPGLTVKDAGAEFGVDPTSLYRVIKQLENDGKLAKRGRELHPA